MRTEKNEGFRITGQKGFHIVFPNGYTLSVQFGPGNYCGNYDEDFDKTKEAAEKGSATAETAYWGPDGEMVREEEDGDTVQGYQTVDQVLDRIARIRSIPKK